MNLEEFKQLPPNTRSEIKAHFRYYLNPKHGRLYKAERVIQGLSKRLLIPEKELLELADIFENEVWTKRYET